MPRDTITIRRRGGYFLAPVTEQTVLFDSSQFTANDGGSGNPLTYANSGINVGGGGSGSTNIVLVACLFFESIAAGSVTSPTLEWDYLGTPQFMTLVPGGHFGTACDAWFFYRINPTLGLKAFRASWTGASTFSHLAAASFINVDQTGGSTTFPGAQIFSNSGSGTNATVSTPAVIPTTRKIMAGFLSGGNSVAVASGTDIGKGGGVIDSEAASWDVGSATSMNYTFTSAAYQALAVTIKGA